MMVVGSPATTAPVLVVGEGSGLHPGVGTAMRPRIAVRLLRLALVALAVMGAVGAWRQRAVPLQHLGAALVAQDAAVPADVAVVSMASPRGAALDAAKLYRRGLVQEIWVPRWRDEPVDRRVAALGVRPPRHDQVARDILRHAGVPASAIVVLDDPVDGLDREMAVVGAALRRRPDIRPIVLTARTHTARARLLLREAYAPAAHARVRAPHADGFTVDRWWHQRGAIREVALEYAKWVALLTGGPSIKR
jgi:uncharacterized SAM-binding protein YcdF (DUF218 family)